MKQQLAFGRIQRAIATLALIGTVLIGTAPSGVAAGAGHAANAIWVNNQLYSTIATPTAFKSPPEHSTDVIYNFDGSGLTGQRSVAEVAPGDPGYNGGRWRVMGVIFTELGLAALDADNDGALDEEITNAGMLWMYVELGYLEITDTGVRFECPLLPRRAAR